MMVCLILTHNVITIYHKSCWRQLSYCGLHVRAVSVFGKKSDAVCGFLAYFCAVLRFSDPPHAPLLMIWQRKKTVTVFLCYQNRHLYQFPLVGRKWKAENYAKTGIRDIRASSHSIYLKIDSKGQVIHKLESHCITHDSSRSGPTVTTPSNNARMLTVELRVMSREYCWMF